MSVWRLMHTTDTLCEEKKNMKNTRSRSSSAIHPPSNEDASPSPPPSEDLLDMALDKVYRVSELTSPDISIGFITFLVVVSAVHETDARIATGFVVPWIIIQLFSYVTTKNFRNQLFWSILGLGGKVLFYLLVGHFWSYLKLYIEISQGRLVVTSLDVVSFYEQHKWLLANWTIQWPASILYTVSKDPIHIITSTLERWSRERYMWIISNAMSSSGNTVSIWWLLSGIASYFACGFVWSHIKLFIDVWQNNMDDDPQLVAMLEKKEYRDFYLAIKWTVLQWMFTWPFSALYNVIRYPMRIFAEFVYHLSERRYIWVTQKAVEMRQ